MLNTPPTFAWYFAGLVFQWLKREGGVAEMARRNRAKSEALYAAIDASPHSLLPVADGSPDKVFGVARVRDVQAVLLAGGTVDLSQLAIKAEVIPDQLDSMDALRILQQSGIGMAMVTHRNGRRPGFNVIWRFGPGE